MILINIFSFFVDGIISLFLGKDSLFIPLFTLMSLIVSYPLLKNKSKIIAIGTILGLLYDIVYTQMLFTNTIIFFVMSLFILVIFRYLKYNTLNSVISSLLLIISYRFLSYLSYFVFNDVSLNLNLLLKSIYSSILLNLIYVLGFNLVYYLLKIEDKKPDKYIYK